MSKVGAGESILVELCARDFLQGAVDDECREIATEVVRKIADDFLIARRAVKCLDYLISDIISELAEELIYQSYGEVELEIVSNTLLEEVSDDFIRSITDSQLANYKKRLDYDNEIIDKNIISEHAKTIIARNILVGHLLMLVSHDFDDILVRHFARGLVNRMAMIRLLTIVDRAELMMKESKKNAILRELFKCTAQPIIRDLLLNSTVQASKDMMKLIDACEEELLLEDV